jgi:hypothetical protein
VTSSLGQACVILFHASNLSFPKPRSRTKNKTRTWGVQRPRIGSETHASTVPTAASPAQRFSPFVCWMRPPCVRTPHPLLWMYFYRRLARIVFRRANYRPLENIKEYSRRRQLTITRINRGNGEVSVENLVLCCRIGNNVNIFRASLLAFCSSASTCFSLVRTRHH